MFSYALSTSEIGKSTAGFDKEANPRRKALLGGSVLGSAGGGLMSYMKQKADIYSGESDKKRLNPYDIAQSALVGGALGGAGGMGVHHADNLSRGAKSVLNEIKQVSRSVKDMGDVARKAKNNRAYGFFTKGAMRGRHIDVRDGGEEKEASQTTSQLKEALHKIGEGAEKFAKIRKSMERGSSSKDCPHAKSASWSGAPITKTANPYMPDLEEVEAKRKADDLYRHAGRAEDAVSSGGLMKSIKSNAGDLAKKIDGGKAGILSTSLLGGTALGIGASEALQGAGEKTGTEKIALGLPSLKAVGAGVGAAGLGGAAGYGAGRLDGWSGAKKNTQEEIKEHFMPDHQTVRDRDGNKRHQRVWVREPRYMRGIPEGAEKEGSARSLLPSKSQAMKGLGLAGLAGGAGTVGYVGGEEAGEQSYNNHVDENYMRGMATVNTPMGARRLPAITKRLGSSEEPPERTGRTSNQSSSQRGAHRTRMKQASTGLSPLNFAAKTGTIDMTEKGSSAGKTAVKRPEKRAFGMNTIFGFNGSPTGGPAVGGIGTQPQAPPPGQAGSSGENTGANQQPKLPSKQMRQDQPASRGDPKELENKIKEMTE